ncbi:GNAT family N-acetyltransferase [Lottiidibacillus patelloidae]|uniref:GNAT family N-acetyltransferase n=1 Tax=Lottiidibacillus patelloidae TaxID=2670334 RepID=A0A263BTG0_9BACI|nr:GNAT family N-acetyltransferase [Lottiidibacillus patelloidae]OZM56848.1 GNAT family N-acetyltransferase [Lottiidibacillus patelloidae]
MNVISNKQLSQTTLENFFTTHWGSPEMVISSGTYDCSKLEGFAKLNNENEIIGLITFIIKKNSCEIISLDSLEEGKGIGTSLLKQVEQFARGRKCYVIKLVTTNDNLHALKFYQKRGYQLVTIHKNAVVKAREIKPQIPLIGNDGIPIRDEIELEKKLD